MDWMHVLFAYKMKVYVNNFFSKSKQTRSFLWSFSYFIKKFLLKKYIFFLHWYFLTHLQELNDHTKSSNSYIEILHTYIDWPETSLLVCVTKSVTCDLAFSIFSSCLFLGHLHWKVCSKSPTRYTFLIYISG